MCVVSRVSIDARACDHYVNLNVIEQKYITEECITENTLLEVNEKLGSKNDGCWENKAHQPIHYFFSSTKTWRMGFMAAS